MSYGAYGIAKNNKMSDVSDVRANNTVYRETTKRTLFVEDQLSNYLIKVLKNNLLSKTNAAKIYPCIIS